MASETTLFISSNGANMIQTAPGLPSIALQASGAIPYPQYGVQQLGIPTSAPQQVPQKGPLERFLKAEAKVLGAIQIMIGLIHIGFGAIFFCFIPDYITLSASGGYPFWGGIFVKTSLRMNITSAIMALIGIILYLSELISNSTFIAYYPLRDTDSVLSVGFGLSSLLLLFSLLEFCITVPLAHFGCQATCCRAAKPTVLYVPYQVIGGGEVAAEPNPPPQPPTYDKVVTKSQ